MADSVGFLKKSKKNEKELLLNKIILFVFWD